MKPRTLISMMQNDLFKTSATIAAMALAGILILPCLAHAQSVVATVPVGTAPQGIAVDPITNNVFVANQGGNSITVISGATSSVLATVNVGSSPTAVAVNPATGMVYVANGGSTFVSTINEKDLTATPGSINVGVTQNDIAVDAASNTIVAVSTANDAAVTIAGSNNAVTGTASVGTSPKAIAINPVTHIAYVTNFGSGTVSVVDESNPTAAGAVTVGSGPLGIAVNAVTNQIYVANSGGSSVSVIDGASNTIIASPAVGTSPRSVSVDTATNTIYVANSGSATVSVIGGQNNTVLATPAVGPSPYAVAVDTVTDQVFVLCQGTTNGSVSIIDGASNAVTLAVSAGATPSALAINPATDHAYIANSGSNNVSIIAGTTNKASAPIAVPASNPSYLASMVVNPITGIVYTSSAYDPSANTGDITAFKPDGSGIPCDGGTQAVCTLAYAPGKPGPVALTVNIATDQIIAANGDGSITVVNGASNSFTSSVNAPVGSVGNAVAVAVNPVTNSIYVVNQGNGSNGTVTAFTNGGTSIVPLTNSFYPSSVLVDPNTNLVYVAGNDGGGGNTALFVIDGVNNTTKATYSFLSLGLMALSKNNGTVFVSGDSQITEILPDGTQKTITPNLGGSVIFAIAVDSASNTAYVAASNGSVAAINGTDQSNVVVSGAPSTGCANYSNCTASPSGIGVDNATGQIYVANKSTGNVTVIDGASNSVITTVSTSTGYSPNAVTVDQVTHQAFVLGQSSGNPSAVETITPANVAPIPLTVKVQPSNDPDILSYAPILQTTNLQPGFTLTPDVSYASSAPYNGVTASNPTPTAVYYQVDTWQGTWLPAIGSSGAYSTSIPTPLALGAHILYSYAVYGREGTPESNSSGASSAPETGQIQSTLFLVTQNQAQPIATSTTLKASSANVSYGGSVTLMATVTVTSSGSPVPGGTVTFYYNGATSLGTGTIDGATGEATLNVTSLPAGSDSITASYATQGNYAASTSSPVGVTVAQPSATMTLVLSPLSPITYGTSASVQVALAGNIGTPTGTVSFMVDGGTAQVAPLVGGAAGLNLGSTLAAGNHTIAVTYSGDTNYAAITTPQTVTLVVNKATPVITWTTPAAITYGAQLGATQLDASSPVAGTYVYAPAAGSIPAAGSQTLSVRFTPADTTDYTTAFDTVAIQVNTKPLSIVVDPETRAYGVANPILTGSVNGLLPQDTNNIAVTYSTTATISSPVGSYPITAVVSGPASINYQPNITPSVLKVTPVISALTWGPAATSIVYGEPLGNGILDATSGGIAGNISYTVAGAPVMASSILPAGAYAITATFTPTDTTDYTTQSKTISITVEQAPLVVSVDNATIAFGAPFPAFTATLQGLVNGNNLGNGISIIYATTATANSVPGVYPITASISGAAAGNYSISVHPGTLTITADTQTITFPAIGNVVYGVAPFALRPSSSSGLLVSISVLSGPATISGNTLSVQGAGKVVLQASQAGNTQYQAAQPVTQSFLVAPAELMVYAQNTSRVYGDPNPTFAYTMSGFVNGDTQRSSVSGAPSLTTTATVISPAGTYPINITANTLSAPNYTFQYINGTLTVSKATGNVFLSGPSGQVTSGSAETFVANVVSATSGIPTGTVSFMDGGTVIGTAALNTSGTASFTTSTLAVGTDVITAQYSGDQNFSAMQSNDISVIVLAPVQPNPTLTLGLTPSVLTVVQGGTASTTLSLTPAQGYSGKVTLSCLDLPQNMTCNFASPVLQFTGNNQVQKIAVAIYTNVDTQLASRQAPVLFAPAIALGWPIGLTGLLFAGKKRNRAKRSVLKTWVLCVLLFTVAGFALMGCAGGGPSMFTTPAGTQTILIQATNAQGGQQSIPLQITVTLN
ncbi:MAG: Ig-like domain repeat protein [Acidobacteriaceae bacterium]